jgi:hypothetical protein
LGNHRFFVRERFGVSKRIGLRGRLVQHVWVDFLIK